MQVPESHQTGVVGLHEVMAKFERIGWGPVENASHDFGIDLFVQARDDRRFDRGLLVSAQVKGGGSWFEEPVEKDGAVSGWVYRESDVGHLDYWLDHSLPHLLVLHDLALDVSYWAHVSTADVVRTGKGWKILVPASQRIDAESRTRLWDIAVAQRPSLDLVGSGWSVGRPSLSPGRQWRHALLVPRLIAPHRNAGFDTAITAPEAAGLVVQGRLVDLKQFADTHPAVPDLATMASSSAWGWRFVAALSADPFDAGVLEGLIESATTKAERAAAVVAAAVELAKRDVGSAVALLEREAEDDSFSPGDVIWILTVLARYLAEAHRVDDARACALECLRIAPGDPADVSIAAILASASLMLWRTAGWLSGDFEQAIKAADTPAAWWRAQTTAWALSDYLDDQFARWAGGKSLRFQTEDRILAGLRESILVADFSGDHFAHSNAVEVWAKYSLMNRVEHHASALSLLRVTGNDKAVKAAAGRLLRSGPLAALKEVAEGVTPASWTLSAGRSNLLVLEYGGVLLDESRAEDALNRCLDLADGTCLYSIDPSRFDVVDAALSCLPRLLAAAPVAAQQRSAERLLPLLTDELQGHYEQDLYPIIDTLDWTQVDGPTLDHWVARAESLAGSKSRIATRILSALAAVHDRASTLLWSRAAEGDLSALLRLDPDQIEVGMVRPLIPSAVRAVETVITDARSGSWSLYGRSPSATLAFLNVVAPEAADWSVLV